MEFTYLIGKFVNFTCEVILLQRNLTMNLFVELRSIRLCIERIWVLLVFNLMSVDPHLYVGFS